MALPIPYEAIIAGVSGLGGAGSGLAIFRHFATKWADEREAKEAKLQAQIDSLSEQLTASVAELHRELDAAKTDCAERSAARELETQLAKAELRGETHAAVGGLRESTDKRIDDVVKSNHDLREKTGVWMAKVEEHGRILTQLATNVEKLTDKVTEGITAITALTGRLQGAGLLRRAGDKSGDS